MSLSDNFLNAAKQIFLATENIKRLDEKVHALASDVGQLDRRLVRVETFIEMAAPASRRRPLS